MEIKNYVRHYSKFLFNSHSNTRYTVDVHKNGNLLNWSLELSKLMLWLSYPDEEDGWLVHHLKTRGTTWRFEIVAALLICNASRPLNYWKCVNLIINNQQSGCQHKKCLPFFILIDLKLIYSILLSNPYKEICLSS